MRRFTRAISIYIYKIKGIIILMDLQLYIDGVIFCFKAIYVEKFYFDNRDR